MRLLNPTPALGLLPLIQGSLACSGCFGPVDHVEHVRHVKRMQPDALNATYGPTRALEVSLSLSLALSLTSSLKVYIQLTSISFIPFISLAPLILIPKPIKNTNGNANFK